MSSNSKLCDFMKAYHKETLQYFKSTGGHVVNDGITTIAYTQISPNLVEFTTSICSPDEIKFRRKVGEYYALKRFEEGLTVKMVRQDFLDMMKYVFGFNIFDLGL